MKMRGNTIDNLHAIPTILEVRVPQNNLDPFEFVQP
jgi:hypothetical protein